MIPTMHIELVKMSQFFARPIGNEDKKFVGLSKQVKTDIGLRIFEEYGLAELVKKIPFGPFWTPTKKLNRDLKKVTLLRRKRNLKAAAALLSSMAVSKGKVPAQVTPPCWRRQHERYAQHFRKRLNLKYLLYITISAMLPTMQQKGSRRKTMESSGRFGWYQI
jgi:hypothetical protein